MNTVLHPPGAESAQPSSSTTRPSSTMALPPSPVKLLGRRHRELILSRRSRCRPARGGGSVMRIVDAQIHLWGSGLPSNMAHRQVTSFTTEEAVGLMDEGGVDAAVIHPPGWDP